MPKHKISDEELIAQIKAGEQSAYNILLDRYLKKFHMYLIPYTRNNSSNYSEDDLLVVYLSTFDRAVKTYRNLITPFEAYFAGIISRDFSNYFRMTVSSNDAIFKRVSIYNPDKSEEENNDLFDIVTATSAGEDDIRNYIDANESAMMLSNIIDSKVSRRKIELTKKIVALRIKGYSMKEIGEKLDIDECVVKRILNKLKPQSQKA